MEESFYKQAFKQTCWLHLSFTINRYLMSNAEGRHDGHEKAHRHIELCRFYVAAVRGCSHEDQARRRYEDDYQAVHTQTQELTDYLDERIGFPLKGLPDYDKLAPLFFEQFHALALTALGMADAITLSAPEQLYRVVPHPKLKRDYVGRQVRLVRELTNGYASLPVGTRAKVDSHNPRGSNLKSEPCEVCGVRVLISRVAPDDIEFVEREDDLGRMVLQDIRDAVQHATRPASVTEPKK